MEDHLKLRVQSHQLAKILIILTSENLLYLMYEHVCVYMCIRTISMHISVNAWYQQYIA